MSRTAIAVTTVLLLLLAFLLTQVDAVLSSRGTDLRSVVADVAHALIVFLIAAVIPLIIWGCLRFRRESAVLPLAMWGGFIGLIGAAPILAAHVKPIVTAVLEIPSVKRGFRTSFVSSATKSCVASVQAKGVSTSASDLESRCQCSANAIVDGLTPEEFATLILNAKSVPPDLRDKIMTLATTCRSKPAC